MRLQYRSLARTGEEREERKEQPVVTNDVCVLATEDL